jgi:hypothetical protein
MKKTLWAASLCAAALIPTLASAQQSCHQQRNNQVAGTVIGAGIGAIIGNAVAPRGSKGAGTAIGAGAGALVGNQATKPGEDCDHAYGYYDGDGHWHATGVDRAYAHGYYDRRGNWVDGPPNGYYDTSGQWVSGGSSGYYDDNGGWVPPAPDGYYDDTGRWMPVNGPGGPGGPGGGYGGQGGNDWGSDAASLSQREDWMQQHIVGWINDGSLSHHDGKYALQAVIRIRSDQAAWTHHGHLRASDAAALQTRLDQVRASVRQSRGH